MLDLYLDFVVKMCRESYKKTDQLEDGQYLDYSNSRSFVMEEMTKHKYSYGLPNQKIECGVRDVDVSRGHPSDQNISKRMEEKSGRMKVFVTDKKLNTLLVSVKQVTSFFPSAISAPVNKTPNTSLSAGLQQMGDGHKRNEDLLPPATDLSKYIERQVNAIPPANTNYVFVREMSNVFKIMVLAPCVAEFVKQFGILSPEFPYRSRVFMLFQETKFGLMAFFAVYVQEYGDTCPYPNRNTAYIAMLDSVQLYEPSSHRRLVFFTVLLSYMNYLRNTRCEKVFLWACPPGVGKEYLFHCRPKTQKTPTQEVLQSWYKTLMEMGVLLGTLEKFENLFEWCPQKAEAFFRQFPYFYEDHWPMELEYIIKSFENNMTMMSAVKTQKLSKKKKKTTQLYCNSASIGVGDKNKYVFEKLLTSIKTNQKSFLCMTLKKTRIFPSNKVFRNYESPSLFVDSRDDMVKFFKENRYTFSDRSRAADSTRAILAKIKTESQYLYCDVCTKVISNGYSCQECRFDACTKCIQKYSFHAHEHELSDSSMCRNASCEKMHNKNPKLKNWRELRANWFYKLEDELNKGNSMAFLILCHLNECQDTSCRECMQLRDLGYLHVLINRMDSTSADVENRPSPVHTLPSPRTIYDLWEMDHASPRNENIDIKPSDWKSLMEVGLQQSHLVHCLTQKELSTKLNDVEGSSERFRVHDLR